MLISVEVPELSTRTKTVLVAEASPDILFTLTGVIAMEGFEVVSTGDGGEACDLARVHRPDLVIVGEEMPGVFGRDLIQILRTDRQFEDTPIILVSPRQNAADEKTAFEVGATVYARIPISPTKIVEWIASQFK